ncbi:MAG TPA: hypothetical protein VGO09_04640 [Flavisolibacter sp.]|nr:hypothetical protein [Flavisolibacter sp.]
MFDFKERIIIKDRGSLVFNFIKIHKVEGADYFITVEEPANSISFRMRWKKQEWKIVDAPKVPDWIMEVEEVLSEIIKKIDYQA